MKAGHTPAGAGDASARVAGDMGWRARLVDVARFAVRPSYAAQPMAWGRGLVLAVAVVLALDMALYALSHALAHVLGAQGSVLPRPLEAPASLAKDAFTGLLLAPALEEALFRGWMRGQVAALRFAVYGFAAFGLFAASLIVPAQFATMVAVAAAALAFAGLIHWGSTAQRDTMVPAWFARHFVVLVWSSTLLFGLIHLGNYEPLTSPLGVLVVVPQTVGGLLLAYTRTRLGLGAAVAHHAAYNAVLIAVTAAGW